MSLFGSRVDRSAEDRAFEYLNGKQVIVKLNNGAQIKGYVHDQDDRVIVLTIPSDAVGDRKCILYRQNIVSIEEGANFKQEK